MSQVTDAAATAGISDIAKVGMRNPQLALSMLMMDIAKTNKDNALGMIKEIEGQQAEKRAFSNALNAARECKADNLRGSSSQAEYDDNIKTAKDWQKRGWAACGDIEKFFKNHGTVPGEYGSIPKAQAQWEKAINQMTKLKEVNAACDKMGISMPSSSDKDKNGQEWDKVIAQLQTKLDTVGSDIQTQMVKMQDMMGQYNSMTQGANSAIAQANQTLQAIAKNA